MRLEQFRRLAAFCAMLPIPATAAFLAGVEATGQLYSPLYRVDPATGDTARLGGSAYPAPLTGAPGYGQAITISPVNPYLVNVSGGSLTILGDYLIGVGIPAYDTDRRTLWGASGDTLYDFGPVAACTAPPCPRTATPVGPLGISSASLILDYAPGLGLFGISGSGLFRIDRNTGHATSLFAIPLPGSLQIWDFAYDEGSGKFIVVAIDKPLLSEWPPQGTAGSHGIYSVDPATGSTTLLTDQGPVLVGIARVDVPEAGGFSVVGAGIASLVFLRRCCRNGFWRI